MTVKIDYGWGVDGQIAHKNAGRRDLDKVRRTIARRAWAHELGVDRWKEGPDMVPISNRELQEDAEIKGKHWPGPMPKTKRVTMEPRGAGGPVTRIKHINSESQRTEGYGAFPVSRSYHGATVFGDLKIPNKVGNGNRPLYLGPKRKKGQIKVWGNRYWTPVDLRGFSWQAPENQIEDPSVVADWDAMMEAHDRESRRISLWVEPGPAPPSGRISLYVDPTEHSWDSWDSSLKIRGFSVAR